ncbi:ketopantoate reductase [Solibacillus silvestris StLB046]|uniref:2-dehydropantoate 2-reductase n=1 Tax=Solibacillus silvestris (strain StLB046) TaxID=1002809 RepID=F2F712_SOLSS|nr:2-dehydropantoate 2-reductase [Solibacillus silvestris]BAK17531.1 ketopantoate reductase [Solibacillus silvestris StLB046]
MRIEIIGAGAVGLLVASYFAEKNMDVYIVGKPTEETVFKDIQIARTNLNQSVTTVNVKYISALSNKANLIIVAVKYGQLHEVYASMEHVKDSIPLLFLQNGLAHYEEALALSKLHIAFSSIQFGALKFSEHHVAHKGEGMMKIAVAKGAGSEFSFLNGLSSAELPIVFEQDAEKMLMEKALLNCFINPLTAILQVKNGQLITQSHTLQLLKDLYNELMTAFPQFKETFHFNQVIALCEKTAENTSSMLADRLANRKTEIDTIAGAILKKAEQNEKKLPVLQTLYYLVKAFEESGEQM